MSTRSAIAWRGCISFEPTGGSFAPRITGLAQLVVYSFILSPSGSFTLCSVDGDFPFISVHILFYLLGPCDLLFSRSFRIVEVVVDVFELSLATIVLTAKGPFYRRPTLD